MSAESKAAKRRLIAHLNSKSILWVRVGWGEFKNGTTIGWIVGFKEEVDKSLPKEWEGNPVEGQVDGVVAAQ